MKRKMGMELRNIKASELSEKAKIPKSAISQYFSNQSTLGNRQQQIQRTRHHLSRDITSQKRNSIKDSNHKFNDKPKSQNEKSTNDNGTKKGREKG